MIRTYGLPRKIDNSDWSVAVIRLCDGREITERTLQSEAYFKELCEKHGWALVSFAKGENPYCS